jgi:hypothetical protein
MTQPAFAPVPEADQVRQAMRLRTPSDWRTDRVADFDGPNHPEGGRFGRPGPDQGYALKLGHDLFEDRLELSPGEQAEDAIYGCAMVASARSAMFGRAPVAPDLEMALTLFGFLGGASAEHVEWRRPLFLSVSHHYGEQRALVAAVPEGTLRMTAQTVRAELGNWKGLFGIPSYR